MILRPLGRLALHGGIFLGLVHCDDFHATRADGVGIRLGRTGKGAGNFLEVFLPRAGDDLDDIASEGGGDLDLEAVLHRAGNINGLPGGDVVLGAEGIREEEDLGAVDLVVDDRNVGVVAGAAAEGDGLTLGVAALPIDGVDLDGEVFLDFADFALDVLDGGGAFLQSLWGDGYFGLVLLLSVRWPDAGGDFARGDDDFDLPDLSSVEVGDLGVDGEVRGLVVEAAADHALNALDLDFLHLGAGLNDVLGLELALVLEVGDPLAGDDLEFAGLGKGDPKLVLQHGGVGGEEVGVLVDEVPDADVDLPIASGSLRESLSQGNVGVAASGGGGRLKLFRLKAVRG